MVLYIVSIPGVSPLTTPPTTVAIVVLVLVHVPPPIASVRVVLVNWQKESVPVIGDGELFTVTVTTALHALIT